MLVVLAGPAAAQGPGPEWGPPSVVDGPSADIADLSGFSVARDGTGGLVYLKNVGATAHVFVSRLIGGVFQTPEQLDSSLPGASSSPVIAAGNGGLVIVAFVNAGSLYVVSRPDMNTPYVPAIDMFDGAASPSLSISNFGKAYLAFTANDSGGHDVRAAYYFNGQWALEPSPLNAVAADDAGTGTGRPAVGAAGDGVGIVAWGEGGHVYARRVWGTNPSVVYEQADVATLGGWTESSADEPSVGVEGNSSYADIVFHETLKNGLQQQQRVLMSRLHGSKIDPVSEPDGLSTPGTSGGLQAQVAEAEYGAGFVTSARDDSNQLWTTLLGDDGVPAQTFRVDSLQNLSAPHATSGIDGLYTGLIAWQQDPGPLSEREIRARWFDGSNLQAEVVLSSPTMGATDAASGIATAGDASGDGAVVWIQGSGSLKKIVAAQLYQGPGSFALQNTVQYVRTTQPAFTWSPAREFWGPLQYNVTIDGTQVGQTTATSFAPTTPLTQGPHSWQVTGVNPVGLSTTAHAATVFVDTIPPVAQLSLTGRLLAGSFLHAYVSYTDAPPALVTPAQASGIASVLINWGDGSVYVIRHGKFHAYRRAGHYTLTATVSDRAGNVTTVSQLVIIKPKPKPKKPKPKHKPGKKGHR
jgi:hypothetical protein